ncbi:transposon Tf2-11 polyprotein [Trichonephila clavipes]|nr:transposon Tf2-11 polyprotein [Trichonephila clavipes]
MQHVDALSRYPVTIITSDTLTARLQRAQQEDENIKYLKSLIGTNNATDFFIKNEILYKYVDGRELIAAPRDMQTELIKLAHEKGLPGFIPVKSTTLEDSLDKLKLQQKTFGNPKRIITDRGSPFNSKGFGDYCTEEKIQNLQITTGVPRGNGQVEIIHRTLIPVLTKLSIDDPTKWYKFVDRLQRILNSTSNRSTKWSPFELLTGVTMRNREDLYLRNLLMEEMVEELQEQRKTSYDKMRKEIFRRFKQKIKEPTIGNARGHLGIKRET